MRIAIISDIHANLPALQEVLKKIEELQADVIHCLGDIVGYGPFPNECVDLVRQHCRDVVKGNHDSGLVGETPISDFNPYGRAAIQWTTNVITPENLEYLRSLPFTAVADSITLVHSSPVEPEDWIYVMNLGQARECFETFTTDLCFIGHTHVPVIIGEDRRINQFSPDVRQLINVGSVGQPRDGNPHAAFGLLDTDPLAYQLVRVEYDVEIVAAAIDKAGLPAILGQRLFQGL